MQVIERDLGRHGGTKHPRMGDHPEKLIHAWPGNRPGQRVLRQPDKNRSGRAVEFGGDDFRVDQNIRIDGAHGSTPGHDIEETVTVEQIDAWLLNGLPTAKVEPDRFSRGLIGERLPKQLVRDVLKSPALFRRFLLQPAEEVIVNGESRPSHASKCIRGASICRPGPAR